MAKTKLTVPVATLDQADQALAEIASLTRQIARVENELNERIDALKAQAKEQVDPWKLRLEALERGLKAFAKAHKDALFTELRSCEVLHGSFGFRRSTVLRVRKGVTWGEVLDRLGAMGRHDAIRVRKDVDKEALRQWPEADLEPLGVKRHEKDVFWYEVKAEQLDDVA